MLRGVVEGFYGRPYEGGRREVLLKHVSSLPDASWVYAPKNDPYHRLRWRVPYPEADWGRIAGSIRTAADFGVSFIFGVSPWGFRAGDHSNLRRKLERALDSGAAGVAVLYDDIPQRADGDLARRQIAMAEKALDGIGTDRIFVCPSVYCTELLLKYDADDYLEAWRQELPSDWIPFWTGDEVVSRVLTGEGLSLAESRLGARPAIWDNLLADDYCLRRIFLADLDGRIAPDHHYFLNPSECFPAALYAVHSMNRALESVHDWPEELGGGPGEWNVLAGFHCSPWTCGGEVADFISLLPGALDGGPDKSLLTSLDNYSGVMDSLLDSQESAPFGQDLSPYLRDIRRLLGQWREALMLPTAQERCDRIEYLLRVRLPYENPLADVTAGVARTDLERLR